MKNFSLKNFSAVMFVFCFLLFSMTLSSLAKGGDGSNAEMTLDTPSVKVSCSKGDVSISWNEIEGAKKYIVYRKLPKESWTRIHVVKADVLKAEDHLTDYPGKKVYYTVRAEAGNVRSDYEKGKSATFLSAPKLADAKVASNGVKISWKKVKGASGYNIYRKEFQTGSWKKIKKVEDGSTVSYVDKKAPKSKRLVYTVRAVAANSISSYNKTGKMVFNPSKKIDPSKPMIALTYDDGPHTPVTNRILDALEKVGGRATFFVVGDRVSSRVEVMKRASAMGCSIQNHSWDHPNLTKLSAAKIQNQIDSCDKAIKKAIGISPTLMRPVGGAVNDTVRKAVVHPMILWSIDTLDWKNRNASSVYNNVIGKVRDGDIVLMHDLYTSTAEASEKIIPKLVDQGYQLVTVEELAYYKGYSLSTGKTYSSLR